MAAAAMLLASACGGGGGSGGGGGMSDVAFESAGSSVSEGAVASVVLKLVAKGGTLDEDVSVTVSDATFGTAVPGSDYTAAPSTLVTFPAGSVTGDTLTVNVTALADTLVEDVAETLRLTLSDPSPGATLGTVKNHELSVQDANTASVAFTQATAATPDEADGTYDATVELTLAAGDSLAVPVTVTVRDSSAGSATSGTDYAAFAPVPINFPAGSVDGASSTVQITVQDDGAMESDETVVLALDAPVSTADIDLGASDEHVLWITEDEVVTAPFLQVTSTDGGSPADVPPGSAISLGSQPSGAGPTAGVTMTLRNLGTLQMSLSQLNLTGDYGDFAIELLEDAGPMPPPAELPGLSAFPLEAYGEDLLQGVWLRFDEVLAAELNGRNRVVLLGVPLPGSELVTLELERARSPWSDDAVLRVDGVDRPVDEVLGDLSLWRGSMRDEPGSRVFLSFSVQGSSGWIQRGDGTTYELVSERAPEGVTPNSRLVASEVLASQGEPPTFQCAEMAPPLGSTPTTGFVPGVLSDELTVGLSVANCRLAVETDFQLFQKFGNVGATTTYVTQLVAALSDRYREDVQTTLSIAYLGVYSSAADPWSSPDGGSDTADMLDEFKAAWDGAWPASADLAHFISGANLGGGIAYINVLCNQSFGYGVSANIDGNIDWDSWDGQPSFNTWDFIVTAHELGHNFGASHTHSYCPPIDHCFSNCDGLTSCTQGTIMSYCHVCGGMSNVRPEFHPFVANSIRSAIGSSCLGGTTLDGGGRVDFQLRFEPAALSGSGAKSATLGFTHDGTNVASPFAMDLDGLAQ